MSSILVKRLCTAPPCCIALAISAIVSTTCVVLNESFWCSQNAHYYQVLAQVVFLYLHSGSCCSCNLFNHGDWSTLHFSSPSIPFTTDWNLIASRFNRSELYTNHITYIAQKLHSWYNTWSQSTQITKVHWMAFWPKHYSLYSVFGLCEQLIASTWVKFLARVRTFSTMCDVHMAHTWTSSPRDPMPDTCVIILTYCCDHMEIFFPVVWL